MECGCGRGPHEEYKYPPYIHHEVFIGGYYRYLHCNNNDKVDENDNNEDTTDNTTVDPAVYPMTLYDRVGEWDTYRLPINTTLLASIVRGGCG